MELPIEWLPDLPDNGRPEQLIVLLHGAGSDAIALLPLAQALRSEFPNAAVLAPDAPQRYDSIDLGAAPAGCMRRRQWFPSADAGDAQLVARADEALAAFVPWLKATQDRLLVPPVATALAGFGQGAMLALQTALRHDGLAGRVLAFSGRFARLPSEAPRSTTLHFFHGGADAVVPASHARAALERLADLRGDATLDVAEEIGHEIHPVLVQRALFRLRNHIPARTWAAALGAVPGPHRRHSDDDEEDD
jgi:phospholipase/carboxylesterase